MPDNLRDRAEELVEDMIDGAHSPDEIRDKLHELRVHQIELAMQNEELRKAQAELDIERERYFDLYNMAPVGYVTLNDQGLILEANLTAAILLGVRKAALIQLPISRFILIEDQDQYYRQRKMLSAPSEPMLCELRLLKNDGTPFWAHLATVATLGSDGERLHRIVLSDVTERKQAESQAIKAAEFYLSILNEAPALIWRAGYDAQCDWFNSTWLSFTGRTLSQEIGNGWIEGIHSADITSCLKTYTEAFQARTPFEMEYRLRRHDGEYRWILGFGSPFDTIDGAFGGYIGYCYDITERKRSDSQLVETNRSLEIAMQLAEAANKTKSEFLANMSHEIRTPLNGVLGMLQLMETTALDDEQNEFVLAAIKSTKRLTALLSDILDLSKIDAGKLVVDDVEFEIENQMKSVLDLFGLPAKNKNLDLYFCIDERVPRKLIGDDARLRQILFNLVGNAVKFTTKGYVRIDVSLVRAGNGSPCRVLFSVEDTGMGIPDNRLQGMFEPFVQGEGAYIRTFQGAGLGLSIVRRLVDLMGGCLSVDNTEGGGTTFYFSLPFKLSLRAFTGDTVTATAPMSNGPASKSKEGCVPRVLLAEDDLVNCTVVTRLLGKLGSFVTVAADGQQALNLLTEQDFDLILMDIQMPIMDGVEATKAIRESTTLGQKSHIPIIAMTAYAMTGDKEKFLAVGMNDYISKPVLITALKDVIARVMDRKEGEKERGEDTPDTPE